MTALTDVFEWSRSRPIWQRDALRRIVTGPLTETDIEELLQICLSERRCLGAGETAPAPVPLTEAHVRGGASTEPVRLLGVANVTGVNRLATGQTMTFAQDGVTIVFGYNGSGKTGYARIFKSLCRARHSERKILSDAFGQGDPPTPSATVRYRAGPTDMEHRWSQGTAGPEELGMVSFFDSECAAVQLDQANEVAFVPEGLDVLPSLATVCGTVSRRIDTRMSDLAGERPVSLRAVSDHQGTAVAQLIAGLTAHTDIARLEGLATFTEADNERLPSLRVILRDSAVAAARIQSLQIELEAVRRLWKSCDRVAQQFSGARLESTLAAHQEAVSRRQVASSAAGAAFGNQPLSGVGEAVWQGLWSAARRYSEQVYPDRSFPNTDSDARCPLCQQQLGPDAVDRFVTFESFLRMDTERLANEAESALADAARGAAGITAGVGAYRDLLPTIQSADALLKRNVMRYFRVAWRVRRYLTRLTSQVQPSPTPTLPDSPGPQLIMLEGQLQHHIEDLQRTQDGDYRRKLETEQRELLARRWLGGVIEDAKFEVNRLQRVARLEEAKRDTVTTGITKRSSELTDRYVTEELQRRMRDELAKLGASHLQVEIESAGGQVGSKRFKVGLRDSATTPAIGRVLSEGEFRCVAIAAFLAEVQGDRSASSILLDDPVSSLDHRWRRLVATRLADVSTERQVIVFTHDLEFVNDLVSHLDPDSRQGAVQVYRAERPGMCVDGLPWESLGVKKRLGHLKQRAQQARAVFRSPGELAYAREAGDLYSLLRETWERAVEEVLLNGVVTRFSLPIQTQRLRKLTDITAEDVKRIDDGMGKCSRFMTGHDTPRGAAEPMPRPEELESDIKALEDWIDSMRPRRN